ncbi:MAG: hypothetical protein JJU29_08835 [Verrucomicrobia bacterium]|nr:hypothetical protein [Verrucomicrobiota bacterium]MCH8511375.1 hypothetical protein [Kiritimatiellia bacterium]
MKDLIPLIPLVIVLIVSGAVAGSLTARRFQSLLKELEDNGCSLNHSDATSLFKTWTKKPLHIVDEAETHEIIEIKRSHAQAFEAKIKPWRIVVKLGPIIIGVLAFLIFQGII